ncbi:hypothetical protein D3C76_1265210 [compost metagenome]
MDDLQLLAAALPYEGTAQDVVAVHRCLPGVAETFDIQTLDVHAQLVDVFAGALLQQAVEQHALLHRR